MLNNILSHFEGVEQRGESDWMAKCPSHEDCKPSLSITKTQDRWLLKCFANCDFEHVIAAAGLTAADLSCRDATAKEEPIEYRYVDEDGKHVYSVLRFPGKEFRQRKADGTWSLKGVERIPYRLPEIIQAEAIFICEGEKDVENLRRLGLVATCNAGGAGKWDAAWQKYFKGKSVYILPDNDEPGAKHAQDVREKIGHGTIVNLPNLQPKGDVSDWIANGGTQEQLIELCENQRDKDTPPDITRPAQRLLAGYMKRLNARELPQLYKLGTDLDGMEIGGGLLTLFGAPPSIGKTALASQIMFDVLTGSRTRVVVANAEMDFDSLVRRELVRRTGISSRDIRFGTLNSYQIERINHAIGELFSQVACLEVLEECNLENLLALLGQDGEPGLLIVDYLQKFLPVDKDARIGTNLVMSLLRRFAKRGWAVVAISATKRDSKGKHAPEELGMHSFRESGDIEYQADSCYLLKDEGPIEKDESVRKVTLKHDKNRHDARVDIPLRFDRKQMRFSRLEPVASSDFDAYADPFGDP